MAKERQPPSSFAGSGGGGGGGGGGGDKKRRPPPARKQANEADVFEDPPHTGFYNIWYDKVQDFSSWRDRRDAKLSGKRFKLDADKDQGETMAKSNAYICLFFARGKCIHGHDCKYKHTIPSYEDEAKLDIFHDCFGRERHRTDREDMGGVGSFNRDNHTLFVAGVRMVHNVEEVIRKHFGKFGDISDLKILPGRSIVFITYKLRVSAEFAKEAMSDQSLIGNEVLNVRWANEDPNPQAQHQKQDKLRAEAWEQIQNTHPDFFKQYELLEQQKYPDTDTQYPQHSKRQSNSKKTSRARDTEDTQSENGSTEVKWGPKKKGSQSPSDSPSSSPSRPSSPRASPLPNQEEGEDKKEESQNVNPQEAEYLAWQTWYRQHGYPGYYDHNGTYHYYDPRIFDPYASGYAANSKSGGGKSNSTEKKQEGEKRYAVQFEELPEKEGFDYYQYYAGLEVNEASRGQGGETTDLYWGEGGYFENYGTEEGQDALSTSNAPLYQ